MSNFFAVTFAISILMISVILHEIAHGWTALYFGDDTAKRKGRVTLNPLAHLDPVGSFALPLVLAFLHWPVFGWAKPVPVNFAYLKNPRQHMIWVALAGPATNILLALIFLRLGRLPFQEGSLVWLAINYGVVINLMLAVFNLIPIPPLDGSRVLMGVLPRPMAYQYSRIEPYGFAMVFIAIWLGLFQKWVYPAVLFLATLLGG